MKIETLYSGASIGISIYPDNGNTYQELLKNANVLCIKQKKMEKYIQFLYTIYD